MNDECKMLNDESMSNAQTSIAGMALFGIGALAIHSSFVIRHSSF
jgi:hypothetical protein